MSKFVFHIETVIVDQPAGFLDRVELPIEGDAIEAPVFETHKRGRNWSCFFTGKNAANSERHFLLQRGRVIDVSALTLGMPIEIAGDYMTYGNNLHQDRYIGVVTGKTDTMLTVDKYSSVAKAISAAHKGIVAEPLPEDSDVLEGMAETNPASADPQALAEAVTYLRDWAEECREDQEDEEVEGVPFLLESIGLVLHELERLQQKDQNNVAHTPAA